MRLRMGSRNLLLVLALIFSCCSVVTYCSFFSSVDLLKLLKPRLPVFLVSFHGMIAFSQHTYMWFLTDPVYCSSRRLLPVIHSLFLSDETTWAISDERHERQSSIMLLPMVREMPVDVRSGSEEELSNVMKTFVLLSCTLLVSQLGTLWTGDDRWFRNVSRPAFRLSFNLQFLSIQVKIKRFSKSTYSLRLLKAQGQNFFSISYVKPRDVAATRENLCERGVPWRKVSKRIATASTYLWP